MTGNRTNELNQNETKSGQEFGFTEAQVEAAAEAMYQEERGQTLEGQSWPRWHELCEDNPWSSRCGHLGSKIPYLTLARAALVAAQGAAPQTESDDDFVSPDECPACDTPHDDCSRENVCCEDCSHASGWAPVLPSSTVDKDALAEVLSEHVLGEPNGGTASWAWLNCSCRHRIEIAGVTREHVVALGRKHQARAVAEWLKEQGR